MAVLGWGGRLELRREAPEPETLDPRSINTTLNTFIVSNPAYWSGDRVRLSSSNGLPIDTDSDGPDCPDGYGVYAGSDWYKGSNRSHVVNQHSKFYGADDSSPFYMRPEECGLTHSGIFYIYRDQTDDISFYTTKAAAMNGKASDRIPLYKVKSTDFFMAFYGTTEYDNAVAIIRPQSGDYANSGIYEDGEEVTAPDDLNSNSGWLVQGMLREWVLNLNAPEVDTTSVGERYGESIKSLVTGGGTTDFLIDRRDLGDGAVDSIQLLQLLLLTQRGCKTQAQFWMISGREGVETILPGDLYYETELLITSTAINTRADDIIAGSLNFVTVGEIALRMGDQ